MGLLAVACGAASLPVSGPAASSPAPSTGAMTVPSPSPQALPPAPSPPPAPMAPPVAQMVMPVHAPPPVPIVPMTAVFAIRPSMAGGAGGSVSVTLSGGAARYQLVVTGLRPGSTHAIHDHLGSCAAAGSSNHLTVLAVPTASPAGVITVDTSVPAMDAGSGRIVIVYATANATVISGCADL